MFPKLIGAPLGFLLFAAALVGAGCGSSGTLRVTKVAVSTQRPGNIAFYLDVRDNGKPVAGLQEKDFKVYEDGKLVPAKKGKRALLDAETTSASFTMVQVDLSGPIADSEYLSDLAETVTKFAQDLNERQEVAVNVFDGNDEVAPFIAFGAGKEQFRKLAEQLRTFRPRSRNSNLYGAVYQGISNLEEKMATSALSEKEGNLVVFTDRQDLSHTVGIEQLKEKLKGTSVHIYVIGAGEKISRPELTMLGKTEAILSTDPRGFKKGFEEVNQKLVSLADGKYVFSFCSTKRKGSHKLEVEIETPNGDAKIKHKFNAAGFSNACSPKTKPMFEEIEALKADAAAKQKEIDAREKEKEEAEAAAALAAVKEPAGGGKGSKNGAAKEQAKTASQSPKEMAKAAAKEPPRAAPAPAPAAAKEAPQVDLPPAEKEAPPAPKAGSAKQAVDNE